MVQLLGPIYRMTDSSIPFLLDSNDGSPLFPTVHILISMDQLPRLIENLQNQGLCMSRISPTAHRSADTEVCL